MQTGQARFTFGIPHLLGGIDVVIAAIGFFAIGEVLWTAATLKQTGEQAIRHRGPARMSREDWRRSVPAWIRGTLVGTLVGILPGAGATLATFLSYDVERRASKTPEKFGTGMIEGVAGPEAANNASAGGSMVPLLALGIPGSGTTAVMLAAFQLYGLRPGPLLFTQNPNLVWGLIASLYVSNVLLLVLNLPLIGLWTRLLDVPRPLLMGAVVVFSTVGAYTVNNSVVDLLIVFALGVVSFFMRRHGFPIAPAILGIVLGPLMEQEFRRSLAISVGDPTIFLTRPVCAAILGLSALLLVSTRLKRRPRFL
jgi:putative tricarboxylic transport membrane protein